jgi:tetratricopeptide (TPR) repeat protein
MIIDPFRLMALTDGYLLGLADDEALRGALLACAASLRLDDEVAMHAIRFMPHNEMASPDLLRRLKRLGCVSHQWDGTWRLADEVRRSLAKRLDEAMPPERVQELRAQLADLAAKKAGSYPSDGQITKYRARQAQFEAAFQRTLIPQQTDQGAEEFAEIWRRGASEARDATCRAVDHVADEIATRLKRTPPELLFMQGMAARSRGDRRRAEGLFRAVWENGKPGDIYAIAAHLFGNLTRDRGAAETAFHDSIKWYQTPWHQGQVLHSLGNLLSRQFGRWDASEQAYTASLELLETQTDRGQVLHSLGNLLSRQSGRWDEAEENYKGSLDLLKAPQDRAQVLHSLGNVLSRQSQRWEEAEKAYAESLRLDQSPQHRAPTLHSLANLLSRQSGRWEEAEKAYADSLRLDELQQSRAQVLASWAIAIIRNGEEHVYPKAEEFLEQALSLNPNDARHRGIVHKAQADLFELEGRYQQAVQALERMVQANRELRNWRFVKQGEDRIAALRQRLFGDKGDSEQAFSDG